MLRVRYRWITPALRSLILGGEGLRRLWWSEHASSSIALGELSALSPPRLVERGADGSHPAQEKSTESGRDRRSGPISFPSRPRPGRKVVGRQNSSGKLEAEDFFLVGQSTIRGNDVGPRSSSGGKELSLTRATWSCESCLSRFFFAWGDSPKPISRPIIYAHNPGSRCSAT